MAPAAHRLSFAIVNSRPVFMDLADDSYFLLEGNKEAAVLDYFGNAAPGDEARHLADMLGVAPADIARAHSVTPGLSLLEQGEPHPKARIGDLARMLLLLRRIKRSLLTAPVASFLAEIPMPGAGEEPASDDLAASLSAHFRIVRRLCPVEPNCLLDSLALLHWLGGAAAPCALVFGVKLDPFAAHCWVQTDNLILNDRVDHVLMFEPIRVIRCSAASR